MSFSAARESRKIHRLCETCLLRKARFRYRGVVRANRDHTLCFECYRAVRNRRRARLLSLMPQFAEIQVTRAADR